MKIWNITNQQTEHIIEVGDITYLYGQYMQWYTLIRSINDYFNGRQSQVQLYEDGLPINKKDWQCFFIPFDAEVQLEKITAKSPMKEVQRGITEQIAYSVFYQELQEVWEQFNEEFQLINKKLEGWGLSSFLRPFEEKDINNFIQFQSADNRLLSPLAFKKLLLNIILEKPFDKKTLIIIELPDLYASKIELRTLNQLIQKQSLKGYKFLFVTHQKSNVVMNYYYKNTIINNALLEQMKSKIQKELPFYCSDELYKQAKCTFLKIVDNSISEEDLISYKKTNTDAIVTIIHVIMYNLNMDSFHDIHDLESNLIKFIENYR